MAWYAQNLEAIANGFGTYTVTVNSTVDAGAPDHQTLIGIQTSERLDFAAGDLGDMTMTLTVMEDTTAVAAGWWREVLGGDCTISVLLNDGSGDAWVFSGAVIKSEVSMTELYIGTPNVRQITIPCKSLLGQLATVSIADLITAITDHCLVDDDGATGKFCKITDIVSAAIHVGYSQAFGSTYCFLQDDGGTDLTFSKAGTGYSRAMELTYFMAQTAAAANQGYTDSTDVDNYWGVNYANALELIKAICANFAVVPQYYYDVSDSKHKVRLLQKGRCYTSSVTLPTPIDSAYSPSGGVPLTSALATDWDQTGKGWAWINGVSRSVDNVTSPGYAVPENWEPDLNVPMLFYFDEATTWALEAWEVLYVLDTGSVSSKCDTVTYWNYNTGAGVDKTTATHRPLHQAIVEYQKYRYYAAGFQQYTRTLHTMIPTGGVWDDLKIMTTTTIGSDAFTVTELTRDFLTGQTQVTLLELS